MTKDIDTVLGILEDEDMSAHTTLGSPMTRSMRKKRTSLKC